MKQEIWFDYKDSQDKFHYSQKKITDFSQFVFRAIFALNNL